jgi:hypothetical protein
MTAFYYNSIILALATAGKVRPDTLELTCIPLDCMKSFNGQEHPYMPLNLVMKLKEPRHALKEIVTSVQQLSIGFWDIGLMTYRDPAIARNIGSVLSGAMQLRRLDLMFVMNLATNMTAEFESAWQESFYGIIFPYLESLRLHQTDTPGPKLISFLENHSGILKNLHLSGGHDLGPRHGWNDLSRWDWLDMLTEIRDKLSLEKFELLTYDDRRALYSFNWEPLPNTENANAKKIERFVLGTGTWPFPMDASLDYWGWWVDGVFAGFSDTASRESHTN